MSSRLLSTTGLASGHRSARLLVIGASLLATVSVVVVPQLHAVYPSPTARAAVQTTSLLGGLLLAYLLFGRFRRTGRLDDLLLANSLSIGVCGNLLLLVMLVGNLEAHGLAAWGPALAQVVGGITTCVAAFTPPRVLRVDRRRTIRRSALLAASVFAVLLFVIAVLPALSWLPSTDAAEPMRLRLFSGPTILLVIQALLVLTSTMAAVGFARKADREGDEFAHLLSLAFVLGAFARANYLITPSLYSPWVSAGDLFRMSSWMLMLWAAGREIRSYWDGALTAATLEERRRLARDLHDGLAQELAYISRRARRLKPGESALIEIGAAADRALIESRRAIAALSLSIDEGFEKTLTRTAEDVAARAGANLEVSIDPVARIEQEHADALIRIVCEAVRNATRHGRANLIRVEIGHFPDARLVVRDNGSGFASDAAQHSRAPGFGLVSMRERAAAIGGELHIASEIGAGTTIEVRLP
jgi:signal transduction histidine kinase